MREKWQKQMPLMAHIADHAQAQELEMISKIIDDIFEFTYEELAFHIVDSRSIRWFCRIGLIYGRYPLNDGKSVEKMVGLESRGMNAEKVQSMREKMLKDEQLIDKQKKNVKQKMSAVRSVLIGERPDTA